jgi:hypothetical protein
VPTILRHEGFRFFFFSNEGFEPPHVHPVELVDSKHLTPRQLRRARLLIHGHQAHFLDKWREYFSS